VYGALLAASLAVGCVARAAALRTVHQLAALLPALCRPQQLTLLRQASVRPPGMPLLMAWQHCMQRTVVRLEGRPQLWRGGARDAANCSLLCCCCSAWQISR
jgi:hypothetical protein